MSNRINEPVERLRECPTFESASALARETADALDMPTAVRPSENGWEVLVPPGTAYELNHPEVPVTDAERHAEAAYDELRKEVLDEENALNRSKQGGWFYKD